MRVETKDWSFCMEDIYLLIFFIYFYESTDLFLNCEIHSGIMSIDLLGWYGQVIKMMHYLFQSDDASNPDRPYDLVGVVVHCGSGPNRGHYISIVRSQGLWLLFDDDIVEVSRNVWRFKIYESLFYYAVLDLFKFHKIRNIVFYCWPCKFNTMGGLVER